MEHFLINSSVCLFVLWLFYKLALENTSWHYWKRFYLLGSVVVSLIIPFIVVETIVVPVKEKTINFTNLQNTEYVSQKQGFEIEWYSVLMTIYAIGVVVMLWRFGKNLSTFKIKNEDEISSYKIYQLILRKGITVPHSFFNRIFVSAKDYKNDLIPKPVLEHEKAHLDQKHSLDILLIELLIVLFWFNPIFYILRYSIKLNHEFLADESVIQQGIPTTHYQELILQHATNNYQQSVANTFHFPIIKKRFSIMKTKTSTTNGLIRSLAIIPLITILILSCGEEEIKFENGNQQDSTEEQVLKPIEEFDNKIILKNKPIGRVTINEEEYSYKKEQGEYQFYNNEGDLFDYQNKGYEVIIITEVLEEVTSENIAEYNSLARKHKAYMDKNNTFIVWNDETTRMQLIYNSMNKEQRANNEPWPYIGKHYGIEYEGGQIPPPPPPVSGLDFQKIDEVTDTSNTISTKTTSINIYISDAGKYFIKGEKVTDTDLISFVNQMGHNDFSNIYVFTVENDYKKFAMKRKPEDVYIFICAKTFAYDKDNPILTTNVAKELKPIKLAAEHKSTKEYALELAKTLKSQGIKNISI